MDFILKEQEKRKLFPFLADNLRTKMLTVQSSVKLMGDAVQVSLLRLCIVAGDTLCSLS